MVKQQQFRLVRYFTVASIGLFSAVAGALAYFEHQQASFMTLVQREEIASLQQVQEAFARQQDRVARDDLLAAQERANLDLTRLFVNALWERNVAPFMARVAAIPVDHCRAIPDLPAGDGPAEPPAAKKACFAEVGARLRMLPEFLALDARVAEATRKSSVFKIKVFDLRGVTAYSSEHAQVGEDKIGNAGWRGAVRGVSRSELTHRDRFSAFEGVVANRDLISSYLPVYDPRGGGVVGVFEVYSDVTPLLAQVKASSAGLAEVTRANQAQIERASRRNLAAVDAMSTRGLAIVTVLLAILFLATFALVRHGDQLIRKQQRQRELDAEELQRQNEALADNARLREDMERMSRHDLKTPLNSIIGVSRLLREDVGVAPEHRELLSIAERAGYRMLEMVNLSLDLSRMELGTYPFRPQAVDLADVTGRVLLDLQGLAESARVGVRCDAGLDAPVYARAEELLCYSVLANVLKNAIEATPSGGTVTVSLQKGDPLRVWVRNPGRVPDSVVGRFFDKYVTAGKSGGTGLGTYSARLMARVQAGDLEMHTGEEGTIVAFTLPALRAEQLPQSTGTQRAAAHVASRQAPAAADFAPRRVLIVDDDEYNRLLLLRYFPVPPFTLDTAVNGLAATDAMQRQWPDVVLVDMEMPVMDGLATIAWIRAQEQHAQRKRCLVLMMSSNDDEISMRRAQQAGCDQYLTKPFTREAVLSLLHELDSGSRAVGQPPALPKPRPAAAEQPPVDGARPVRVEADLRSEVPAFLASRVEMLDAMAAALAAGNREELHRVAHRAAGGLSLFGFEWAAWQSRRISVHAGSGDTRELQQEIDRLRQHLATVPVR